MRISVIILSLPFFIISLTGCGKEEKMIETTAGKPSSGISATSTTEVSTKKLVEDIKKPVEEEPSTTVEPYNPETVVTHSLTNPAETPQDVPDKEEFAYIYTKLGQIVIRFFPDDAPNHVENFKKLAQTGFYNGTTFHRVIPGFMIQGGDPNSKDDNRSNDGMGGPGYTINAEFNARKHLRGTLSMARSREINSAGSQFFICVAPQSFLDGQYTVFGEVTEGMDVVDKIVSVPRDAMDNPLEKVTMEKIAFLVK